MRPFMQRPMYASHPGLWPGIWLLIVVIVLVAGAIIIVRMLANRPVLHKDAGATTPLPAAPSPELASTPQRILEERFARGEIDEEEFRRRRDILRGS